MIRGLYTAASGMIYENKRQENIAQNISNVQTPGFKQTYLNAISQEEGVLVNNNGENVVGSLTMKVKIDDAFIQLQQGDLQTSNQSLDFAIEGDGFFTLQGPGGLLYTRDGRFTLNDTGQLVSKEGYPVLVSDAKGAVQPVMTNNSITVSSDGTFYSGMDNYQFVISDLNNVNQISKQGNSLFSYGGQANIGGGDFSIHQYMTEGSNVDATDALVDMIAINRSLQSNSKVLTIIDETLQASVSEIGRV